MVGLKKTDGRSHTYRRALIVGFGLLTVWIAPAATATEDVDSLKTVRLSEQRLRSLVERSELPNLRGIVSPQGSRPAVAEIMISSQGKLVTISVLEAPTLEIAKALQDSLKHWSFKPAKIDGSVYLVGKLTFYVGQMGGQTVIKKAVINHPNQAKFKSTAR